MIDVDTGPETCAPVVQLLGDPVEMTVSMSENGRHLLYLAPAGYVPATGRGKGRFRLGDAAGDWIHDGSYAVETRVGCGRLAEADCTVPVVSTAALDTLVQCGREEHAVPVTAAGSRIRTWGLYGDSPLYEGIRAVGLLYGLNVEAGRLLASGRFEGERQVLKLARRLELAYCRPRLLWREVERYGRSVARYWHRRARDGDSPAWLAKQARRGRRGGRKSTARRAGRSRRSGGSGRFRCSTPACRPKRSLPRSEPRAHPPLQRPRQPARQCDGRLGALRGVEARGERGGAATGFAGDGAARRVRADAAAGRGRELHALPGDGRRADQADRQEPPGPRREQRARRGGGHPGAPRPPGGLLAHPGQRQERVDDLLRPEDPAPRARKLDFRRRHRPPGPGPPDLPPVRVFRRDRRGWGAGGEQRASARVAARGPSLRLHADPQVPNRRTGRSPSRALGAGRHRRHHGRGAPQPVRRAGPQHAAGAAERRVPRLHRDSAHPGRRGADAAGLRRLRQRLRLPAIGGGPGHGAAVLREPRSRTAALEPGPERGHGAVAGGGRARRGAGGEARARVRPRVPLDHERRSPGRGGGGSRAPLLRARLPRQGDGDLHRQGDRGAHARQGRRSLEAPDRGAESRAVRSSGGGLRGRRRDRRPDRLDGGDRHGGRRLFLPERSRGDEGEGHRLPAAPSPDGRGGPGDEVQGRGRPVPARLRLRHVDDRLRRAELFDALSRQADAKPHPDADDRQGEPGVRGEGGGPDRRLRRRVPASGTGAVDLRRRARRRGLSGGRQGRVDRRRSRVPEGRGGLLPRPGRRAHGHRTGGGIPPA